MFYCNSAEKEVKSELQKLGRFILGEGFPAPTKVFRYFIILFQFNRLDYKTVWATFSLFNFINPVVLSECWWNILDCETRHWKRLPSILQSVCINSLLVH